MTNPTLDGEDDVTAFIDGTSVASGGPRIDVINPSTGRRCTWLRSGSDSEVDRAVRSARAAFDDGRWSDTPPSARKAALLRFAELIGSQSDALDALDAEEMGKPVGETFGNAAVAAALVRFYAEAIDKVSGDVFSSDRSSFVAQRRVPRGVVAAVVPWNFPTLAAAVKLAPALAAGNCVVLKPSELSPRSAVQLAHLAVASGIPPGVFNVLPGLGKSVGRALALHRDVDMVTFTGSTAVGKQMLEYSGQSNMKVVMAECGGKSPQIVFANDVELDTVSEGIARFLLINQGQICSVGSRVLVERSIESALVDRIAARLQRVRMGDALDPKTTFGPLASARQCDRVMRYIESGTADGAELVTGGRRALPASGGYFVEPTLFRRVSATTPLAQEEIFGPVLAVIPFADEAEAVRIANATTYGLAAYVWTSDLSRGMRLMRAIRSSIVINAAAPLGEGPGHAHSAEPFGQSGIGTEGGLAGMESYMRRQMIWFNYASSTS